MAKQAEADQYHDFLSAFPFPELRLVRDLAVEATKYDDDHSAERTAIMALRKRVIDGEFDATQAESLIQKDPK